MADKLNIGVIGGGLMGHGIALNFARSGYPVKIFEPDPATRSTLRDRIGVGLAAMGVAEADIPAAQACITEADSLAEAVEDAGFVTEAAPEKPELKQQIFLDLEAAAPVDCIFASNTSVIPITKITEKISTRERAVGTHWWNPPHMIPLVEVIRTQWSSDAAIDNTVELLTSIGKSAVRVEKDVPGFIGNRLQHAMWREAISLVENGICDAAAVDTVVKTSFGRRLSVLGPLEGADLVGTNLALDVQDNLIADLDVSQTPSAYLRSLVDAGKLGVKTGEGFHKWTPEESERLRKRVTDHLSRLEDILD